MGAGNGSGVFVQTKRGRPLNGAQLRSLAIRMFAEYIVRHPFSCVSLTDACLAPSLSPSALLHMVSRARYFLYVVPLLINLEGLFDRALTSPMTRLTRPSAQAGLHIP